VLLDTMRLAPLSASWLIFFLAVGTAAATSADIAAGERLFRAQCSGCHSLEPGQNRAGPTLHGVFGRPSGTLNDFDFSTAMSEADIEWTAESLDTFLADPSAVVPGTKMVLWGLPAEQRRQIIAYLNAVAE
jgi:cytochrome c